MLFGVALFSYVQIVFKKMISDLMRFSKDYEQYYLLVNFLNVLKKFNHGRKLPDDITLRIREYMHFMWEEDRNLCLVEEDEIFLFDQLPGETRLRIFHDFLFSDFMHDFKKMFRFKRTETGQKGANAFIETLRTKSQYAYQKDASYPYYSCQDSLYQNFMVDILRTLEPRFFKAKAMIYNELDEVNELYFIQRGTFDVGYCLNRKTYLRFRFGAKKVIGAFNIFFEIRSQVVFRANSYV